jgi:hypothetical protein
MKVRLLGTLAVACATTVALSAQATPPSSDQTQPSGASAKSKITVSGCLERSKDSAAPTGTTGAPSASMDSSKFVLNNVTPASASGTAGTSGSASTASSYKLDGDDSKLTPHIGHKVEISGTADDRAPGGAKLKVESVKMVAASCSAQ